MAVESPQPTRRGRILIADDTESIRSLFSRLLSAEGYDIVAAADGVEALEAVREQRPDVVLLDITMPRLDGLEVCRRLKSDPATQLMPVVLVTGQSALDDRIKGIEAGADDFLSKPVHPHELRVRVRSLWRQKVLLDALDSAEAAFVSLALTIEARDPYTNGHCERLAQHAVRLGRLLGLDESDIHTLQRGAYLHDLGKVGVPDAVLLKEGPLTADEMVVMRRHPVIGDSLCAPLQSLRAVRPIVLSHHERLDGSGYPQGLRGDDVPLLAQIVGVVDVFDALTSARPYRGALPPAEALRLLRQDAEAGRFSHRHIEAFIETLDAQDGRAVEAAR
jgi:putative two-component system response regulator